MAKTYRATVLYEGDIGGIRHAEGSAPTRAAALAIAERHVPAGTHVVGVVVADDETRFETDLGIAREQPRLLAAVR